MKRRRTEEKVSILLVNPNSSKHFLYFWGIQGHSGNSGGNLVDPTLQDNVLLPEDFTEYIYHIGNANEIHSLIRSSLIPGGKCLKRDRQSVFFTAVNPMYANQDPEEVQYDLDKPRIAVYKNTWIIHQNINIYTIWSSLKEKNSSSIKLDRTQSSFTTHSQLMHAACRKESTVEQRQGTTSCQFWATLSERILPMVPDMDHLCGRPCTTKYMICWGKPTGTKVVITKPFREDGTMMTNTASLCLHMAEEALKELEGSMSVAEILTPPPGATQRRQNTSPCHRRCASNSLHCRCFCLRNESYLTGRSACENCFLETLMFPAFRCFSGFTASFWGILRDTLLATWQKWRSHGLRHKSTLVNRESQVAPSGAENTRAHDNCVSSESIANFSNEVSDVNGFPKRE